MNTLFLNESAPQDYYYKNEPCPKGKGGGVATIYSKTLSISQKTGFKYNYFEVMVLHITLSREKSINDKSPVMLVLATVYRPPGHHMILYHHIFYILLQTYMPSRSLRSASERRITVPSQRGTKSLSRTFSFTVPIWWNDLPNSIQAAESLPIFKKRLKHISSIFI